MECPLTPLQQAYWIGRRPGVTLGGVGIYFYSEFDLKDHDIERLIQAWSQVEAAHEMLRARVTSDGKRLESSPSWPRDVPILDLRDLPKSIADRQLAFLRDTLSHRNKSGEVWPLHDIRLTRLGDRTRLHVGFDGLLTDFRSQGTIFSDWRAAYEGKLVPSGPSRSSFSDFVAETMARRSTDAYAQDRAYWLGRLPDIHPAPDLPLSRPINGPAVSRFERVEVELDADYWRRVKEAAAGHGLRPSDVIAAAYALALEGYARAPRFTINLSVIDQIGRHPRFASTIGEFGGNIFIAANLEETGSFLDVALCMRSRLREDLKHSSFSGVELLRESAASLLGGVPVPMHVVLTYLVSSDEARGVEPASAWLGEQVFSVTQTPQVSLDLQVRQFGGRLVLHFDHVRDLFPEGMVGALASSMRNILGALADVEANWTCDWSELRRSVLSLNIPAPGRPIASESEQPELLHEAFLRQAAQRPDAVALEGSWGSITYRDLHLKAREVAVWLQQRGVEPDSLVGILMQKGPEQIVAALGVSMAGAAYLPIDAGLPAERRRYMLDHGRVETVLVQPGLRLDVDGIQVREVSIEDPGEDDTALGELTTTPSNLVYVIYTSGSTGRPKGVMIEHRSAVNTIRDVNRRFDIGPSDRVLALSSLSFDLSVYDVFGTLAAGGSIILPDRREAKDPRSWLLLAVAHGATIWNSVPSLLSLAVEDVESRKTGLPSSLRLFLLSGDWIPVDLPERVWQKGPRADVASLGGATEASIWSIVYPIETIDRKSRSIPYGYPMDGQGWVVVGSDLEPRPDWSYGELCISGEGLARGYWRDEELTSRRFVLDRATGVRLYRTGDIGRRLPDGRFEIVGREDAQVKIRGFRVELGEIEAVLSRHPDVESAAVTANGLPHGPKSLVAHVVPPQDARASSIDYRKYLSDRLPDYMLPDRIRLLDRFPLTANGKIDRGTLAQADDTSSDSSGRRSRLPIEASGGGSHRSIVSGAVRDQLGMLDLGDDDNFLQLGANSIDILQIVSRIEEVTGIRLELDAVFNHASISGLADLVRLVSVASGDRARTREDESVGFSVPLVIDPTERERFKSMQHGVLRPEGPHEEIVLDNAAPLNSLLEQVGQRRSRRRFDSHPVGIPQLDAILAPLRQVEIEGDLRRLYASAGGLYPVQVFIYAKPGRCEGIEGVWYHDPTESRLLKLGPGLPTLDRCFDRLINRPIFDSSALAIFLVLDRRAIVPLYGDRSDDYARIEAGAMCQILESTAPRHGVGLCQIGEFDTPRVHSLLNLDPEQDPIHCLLGGLMLEQDEPVADSRVLALTPSQEFIAGQVIDGAAPVAQNVSMVKWLDGEVDPALLQSALDQLVASEPALRARLDASSETLRQVILDNISVEIDQPDLRSTAATDPEKGALAYAQDMAATPFNLLREPLVRVGLAKVSSTRSLLILVCSAFVVDCFSIRIALRRLFELANSIAKGSRIEPPANRTTLEGLVSAWRQQIEDEGNEARVQILTDWLAGSSRLYPDSSDGQKVRSTTATGEIELTISLQDLTALREVLAAEGATPFMGLMAGLARCISDETGKRDLVLGTIASVRPVSGGADVVGPFSNPVAVRISGVGEGSPADDLKRVKEAIIFAFNHQTVPWALVEERMKDNAAPIEVSTVYRARTEELNLPGVRVNSEESHAALTRYPIEITLQETPQGVHCKIRFPLNAWEERLAHVIGQDLPRAIRRLAGLSVSDSVLSNPPQAPSIEAVRAATDFRLIHGIVREAWEAELKAPVDPETPFFALGGESMSAVAICGELERKLGYEVELARMFENPSVHSLACKLQKEGRLKSHGSLVQLRAGRGYPILVIPGRFPSPYELIGLARALPGHRPVFFSNVLELPSFRKEEPTVEELAVDLLNDLTVLTDWERTSIIGISVGGIIGYELLSRMPEVPSSCSRLVMTDTDSPASLRDRNSVSEISRILLTGPTQFWWVQKLRRRFRKNWMSRAQRKLARIARSALNRLPLIHLEYSDPAYEYWQQERLFTQKFDRILGRYTIRPARSRVTMLLAKNEVTRPASLVDSWRDASGDKIDLLWYPGRKNVNTGNEPARSVILAHLGNALALNEGPEG